MSDKTRIEWADATWNPITGCTKVSGGCKHCYAERDWARLQHLPAYMGRAFTDVRCHPERLDQPHRWRRPRRIFVNSMSDLFHPAVPDAFVLDVFRTMAMCEQHTFQVLTKRPERMRDLLCSHEVSDDLIGICGDEGPELDWPLPNVHLGVSIEDQATADERIPLLLQTPAAVRWVSAEPLLGPVSLNGLRRHGEIWTFIDDALTGFRATKCGGTHGHPRLDWVVVGGESGPKARPMHPEWVRSLRDQCQAAGVPFLFKQWGEWCPADPGEGPRGGCDCAGILPDGDVTKYSEGYVAPFDSGERLRQFGGVRLDGRTLMFRAGKRAAGRMLDERTWDEYPGAK